MTQKGILFTLLTLACLMAFTASAAETVYRWVDASGVVHYSENPPPNQEYEAVRAGLPTVGTRAAEPLPTRPDSAATSNETVQVDEPEPPTAEEIAAICAQAQADIQQLEPTTRVLVDDGNGGTRRLSDDERLRWLNQARQRAAENCN